MSTYAYVYYSSPDPYNPPYRVTLTAQPPSTDAPPAPSTKPSYPPKRYSKGALPSQPPKSASVTPPSERQKLAYPPKKSKFTPTSELQESAFPPPPIEQQKLAYAPKQRKVPPPTERQKLAYPPKQRNAIALPSELQESAFPPPPIERQKLAYPPKQRKVPTPPTERQKLAYPPKQRNAIALPSELQESAYPPPKKRKGARRSQMQKSNHWLEPGKDCDAWLRLDESTRATKEEKFGGPDLNEPRGFQVIHKFKSALQQMWHWNL